MKPLTKTVVSRSGGIAARFADVSNEPVKAKPVANPYAPIVAKPKPIANAANKPRYTRWREKNPELYKERQAEYMRKRRAKKRTGEA